MKARLFMGAAFGGVLLAGYGRPAQAGSCSLSLGVYLCSGAANSGTDVTQALTGAPLQVETQAGFGIDTTTSGGYAFRLRGTGGITFTDDNTAAITGASYGIEARNKTSGALTITTSGTVESASAGGIAALNYSGTGSLSITTAAVTGARRGVSASNYGSGGTTIDTTLGTVTGTQFQGITANDGGAGDLIVTTASVKGGFHALYARNYGGGLLTIDSTLGTVTATGNDGVFARNDGGGSLSITTATVTGARHGINASNRYSGNLIIDSTLGTVTGPAALGSGILAREQSTGELSITTASVSGGTGITARNYDGGLLSIDSTLGLITGTSYAGIDAQDSGAGDLTITTASVTGITGGISATNNGNGALTIDSTLGTVTATGGSANAITATDNGTGGIDITSAAATGGQFGIGARNFGGGNLTIDSLAGTLTGTSHSGIDARDYGAGNIEITTAAVTGSQRGIYARNEGGGNLTIDTTAGLVTTNFTGYGIDARDTGAGNLSVTTGEVTGSRAIVASNSGGDLTIITHGVVTGSIFAVNAMQTGGGALTLINDGTLRHSSLSSVAPAVAFSADTDGATLRNLAAGTLLGQVVFTATDDRLENAGLWQSAGGVTGFGNGADELFNQAGGVIQAASGLAAETTQIFGLELFRNAGTVSLSDGDLGDRLEVSGDFLGVGGAVAFDVFLDDGSMPADRLVIGGATSGTTLVTLNVLGGVATESAGNGTALIDVSATGDTAAGDFKLAGGPLVSGIYAYDLVLESDGIWYLQGHELGSLGGYANLMSAAQVHVGLMAGAMSERLGELRHLEPDQSQAPAGQSAALGLADLAEGRAGAGQDHGLSVWLKAVAGQGDYDPAGSTAFEQSTQGFALGGDLRLEGLLADGDRLHLGLMAGRGSSQGEQSNAVDFDIHGWSLGLYASYLATGGTPSPYDGLTLDALLHGSLLQASLDSSLPVSHAETDMTAWGAILGVSYGLEVMPGLILEPKAGLAYSAVAGDDFTDSLGVAVALDEGRSLRGHVGVTLQRHWTLHGLGQVAPYVMAEVAEEFLDGNRITANGLTFESSLQGTSYRVGLGLDARIGRDLAIYGGVDLTWGERVDQATQVSAGLRFSF